MELTYDGMKIWVRDFFDAQSTIGGNRDRSKLIDMFASSCKIHPHFSPFIINRDEWIDYFYRHADQYQIKISYEPDPLGIHIDVRTGWASAKLRIEFLHPVTKKAIQPKQYVFAVLQFCIHENKIKVKKGLFARISGYLEGL